MDSDIMTVREVAEYLNPTEKTAYRHALYSKFPEIRVGGASRFQLSENHSSIQR